MSIGYIAMKPIFNTDFDKLALLLLPMFLRTGGLLVALLQAATLPIAMNRERLLWLLADASREMEYGGQACSLQRMLNDFFDPMVRRFKVNGVPDDNGRFTVYAPAGLNDGQGTPDRIQANIDRRKLITTKYTIVWT